MSLAEQLLATASEIQSKTRGGKATDIYLSEAAFVNLSNYTKAKEIERRRSEIETIINRRYA